MILGRYTTAWLAALLLLLATPQFSKATSPTDVKPAQVGDSGGNSADTAALEKDKLQEEIAKLKSENSEGRTKLELDKMNAEIEKLKSEIRFSWINPVAAAVSVAGVVALLAGMWFQRGTALDIQQRADKAALELKISDLLLSSKSKYMAVERLNILKNLYSHEKNKVFLDSFKTDKFPGTQYKDMKMELFKAVAEKCKNPRDVKDMFSRIFHEEEWPKKIVLYGERPLRSIPGDAVGDIAPTAMPPDFVGGPSDSRGGPSASG
jgi:hypothetical protein